MLMSIKLDDENFFRWTNQALGSLKGAKLQNTLILR